jgi:hypothetical protein
VISSPGLIVLNAIITIAFDAAAANADDVGIPSSGADNGEEEEEDEDDDDDDDDDDDNEVHEVGAILGRWKLF